MQKTILISCVGSLVGQNILDALEKRREKLRIIGTNSLVESANNFRCDKTYLVPHSDQETEYMASLSRIMRTEQPDLIIPGRDDDIVIMAKMKQTMPEFAHCFLVGSQSFSQIMDDKVKSFAFASAKNLPFSPTIESGKKESREEVQSLLASYGFPLIAKPSKGNGSRGIWAVMNLHQLDLLIAEKNYAIQPFFGLSEDICMDTRFGLPFFWEIPEQSLYAAQVLLNQSGRIFSSIGFVSKMVAGKCEQLQRCTDPELLNIALTFAQHAALEGWRGPFNIQLKKDSAHGFQVIEMNGRFSGGTSARFYLGFDEVGKLINSWTNSNVISDTSVKEGIDMVTKILADYPVPRDDILQLQTERVWQR